MATTANSIATTEPLFPAPTVVPGRPARVRNSGTRGGRARATPGSRKTLTTTVTITPRIEEMLEHLVGGGHAVSIGDAARQAFELLAKQKLSAEELAAIDRQLEGKETLSA